MGIDGIKSGLASLVSTVTQKVEQKLEQVKPAAPRPPPAKPVEEFTESKKKPMSITGKHTPFKPAGARADLSQSVSSLRSLAQSGVAANAIGVGSTPATADGDALKAAVAAGSDSKIRKLVNANPALLKELTPEQKGKALETLRSGVCSDDDEQAMVNIVRSCETKGELRAVLQAAAGGTSQKEMHKFDKELTDHHPFLIADLLNPANPSLPEVHPGSISANDQITDKNGYPAGDPNASVGLGKGDEAARRKFLDGLTQVDASRATGDARTNGCAAACVIASCLQNDDPKAAFSKLCDYNLKNIDGRDGMPTLEKNKQELTELKKRIDEGKPITRADLDLLQRTTYNSLLVAEAKVGGNTENQNVNIKAVRALLTDSGVGYSGGVPTLVDLDQAPNKWGKTEPDHFVLVRSGKDSEIYDPWPRRDGKQVVVPGSEAHRRYVKSLDEPAKPID